MAATWERLFTHTLGTAATGIDTGVLANGGSEASGTGILAREHLRIEIHILPSGTSNHLGARFNGDSGDNYPITRSTDGAGDTQLEGYDYWYNSYGGTANVQRYIVLEILNRLNQEKLIQLHQIITVAGVGNAPTRNEQASKWANTSAQITDIEFSASDMNPSGDTWASGTSVTIWGMDDQPSTPVYPNLSNGTLFEESDTGKHYMFDGTSAWNETV